MADTTRGTSSPRRWSSIIDGGLAIAAASAALYGQFLLTYHRPTWQLAAGLWIGAATALTWLGCRHLRSEPVSYPVWSPSPEPHRRWPLAPVAAGLACSAAAGWIALKRPDGDGFGGVFLLWLLGIALVAAGFVSVGLSRGRRPSVGSTVRDIWPEAVALAVLVVAALLVRVSGLEHIPVNLGGDEGTWGLEGLAMLDGRFGNPFATGWFGFPNLSFVPWGLSAKIFGNTAAALRLPSVLMGTAAVLATYLLGRELWGRWVAVVGSTLLAFGHFHLHFSRLAVNNIFDTVVAPLAFWLLVRGLRARQAGLMAAAGLVLGLGWYFYLGARLAGIVAVIYVAWRASVERGFSRVQWKNILVVGVAATVVMVPLLMVYVDQPEQLTSRTNQVGIFSSGWLEREVGFTGRSALSLLGDQAGKSILGFNYTLDRVFWYFAQIPLLDFVSATLLVLGLAWSATRCRFHGNVLLLLWFWLSVFFGWMITENPPSSMRVIIVAPALALLAALGLRGLTALGQKLLGGGDRRWTAAVGLTVATVAILNLHFYFVVYTPTRVYGNPTAEATTVLARYLAERGDGLPVYVIGPPFMYSDFGTTRFLAPEVESTDVPPLGEDPRPEFDVGRGARFVFSPLRLDELDEVRVGFPGGTETHVVSEVNGQAMYTLYEVAAPDS